MTLLNKILIALGALLVAILLGVIIYLQYEMKTQQAALQSQISQQQQLLDGITKSSSQWATKGDLDNFIQQTGTNLQTIQNSVSQLNATIVAANNIQANSKQQQANNLPSTSTGPTNPTAGNSTNLDPFGYQKAQQNLDLDEDFVSSDTAAPAVKVPFGSVGFSAWQQNPWSVKISNRNYSVTNVVATDENQQMSVYNKFSITVDGKSYDVPISTAKTVQQLPTPVWSWWNPRLNLGIAAGVDVNPVQGEFTPNVGVSVMSYGQYKTQPDLTVLGVGAGYGVISKRPQLVVTPITFNLGKVVPLIHNTYIGPSAVVGTDGNVGAELGIQVGL